ncbi:MAG: VCBS repeat-containing protein [Kangiellaceae bacterium]|nr:VCBS repeat-containing protein [Kangiellaceae bacterium]
MQSVNARSFFLVFSTLFFTSVQAAAPSISYVSGSGPHPLGTTLVNIEVATDVNANCRLNDSDDGNPSQWTTLLATTNELNQTSQITVANDQDTTRYIRCRNLSTGEVNQTSFIFNITFAASNNTPPSIDSTGIANSTEDTLYTYDVEASDLEDGTTLDFSLINPPGDMIINNSTGLITWTPVNDDVGNHLIQIEVTDSGGLMDSDSYTLSVANVNDLPILESTPVTTANENSVYSYDVDATDPDSGEQLEYELEVNPTDMEINEVSGLITWTPTNAQIGDQAVVVLISDLNGASLQHSFTITVSEVNVAPEFSSTHELTATEGVLYDYQVQASDDNTNDVLSYDLINPQTGMSINSASGVFDWTPTNAQVGAQDVIVTVTDLGGLPAQDTFTIIVANVNEAPIFTSDQITIATENQQYTYNVNAEDDDAGDSVAYSLSVSPSNDMTIDDVSGLIEWTPNSSDIGAHDITIRATDLDGLFAAQSFEITVSAEINDVGPVRTYVSGAGPHPLGTTLATIEIATDVTATCRLNNVDDNNPVGWTTALNSTNNGTSHTADIALTNDEDTTRYIICRDSSTTVVNGVAFVFDITFETSVNEAPTITVINDQTISESSATGSLPFTVSDVETAVDDLTITTNSSDLVLVPLSGIAVSGSGASRSVVVTPANNESGSVTITLTVSDGELTAEESFVVTVTSVNDAPTITAINDQTVDEDTATSSLSFTVDDEETEASSLTITSSSSDLVLVPSANIVLSGSGASRSVIVTPTNNESGSATITLTVSDGQLTSEESFVVTVTAVNDTPTITSINDQTVTESSPTSSLSFTVDDEETSASSLTVTSSSSNTILVPSTNIALSGSGASRSVIVTPASNESGSATITLTVSDGELTAVESFVVTVTAVNDAPTITAINNQTVNEDTATSSLSFTVADTETAASSLTVTSSSSNAILVPSGNVVLSGSGSSRNVVVTPVANESGNATITLTVSDGMLTASTSFAVTVTSVNDAPTISAINNQTINEDSATSSLSFTVADVETSASSLTVTSSSNNTKLVPLGNVVLSGSGASRSVIVTPVGNESGSATITLTVSDGTLTAVESFVVTVTSVNDAPTITAINNQTVNEDTATNDLEFTVADTETSDGDLTVTSSSSNTTLVPSSNIMLSDILGNRSVTVTPADNESGSATITLTVSDGTLIAIESFVVTVTSVNDLPTITNVSNQAINQNAVTGSIPFTVGDVETTASNLTVTSSSDNTVLVPSSNITLSGSGASRTVQVTPATNENGSATITLTVTDGSSASQSTSFQVTVNAPPTVDAGLSQTVNKDAVVSLTATTSDLDGSIETYLWEQTAGPTVSFSGADTDTLSFTAPNYTVDTDLSFSVTVTDDGGLTANDSVTVTVVGVTPDWAKNDAVTVIDDPIQDSPVVPDNQLIGALQGQAGVSGGAASYSIPITLPPGRAGMQPSVSLNYSSRNGNGIMGVGWSLSAGSSISRCAATYAQDGFTGGVKFDAETDRLCLNGQRLMHTNGGNYGDNGAEYRTEIDSFVRVTQLGAINDTTTSFTVEHNDGLIQYFGEEGGYGAQVIPSDQTKTLSWMIRKEAKHSGNNNILYQYSVEADAEVLLSDIFYTGTQDTAGNRKVSFVYRDDRTDTSTSYISGGKVRQTKLLSSITSYVDLQQVASYSLNYDASESGTGITSSTATERPILRSVKTCGTLTTDCFNSTTFEWLEGKTQYQIELLEDVDGGSLASFNLDEFGAQPIYQLMPHGDRNGDGVRDWPTSFVDAEGHPTSNPLGLELCSYSQISKSRVCVDGDYDLNGTTDTLRINNSLLEIGVTVDGSNGIETQWLTTDIPMDPGVQKYDEVNNVADFNGDGWTDLVITRQVNTVITAYVYFNTQDPASPFSQSSFQSIYASTTTSGAIFQHMGDLDGNGLPDMTLSYQSSDFVKPYVSLMILTSLVGDTLQFESVDIDFFHGEFTQFTMFFDVNGDGLQDLLGWDGEQNGSQNLHARINLGNGTFSDDIDLGENSLMPSRRFKKFVVGQPGEREFQFAPRYADSFKVMDIDGDGRNELLMPSDDPADMLVEGCVQALDDNVLKDFCGAAVYGDTENLSQGATVYAPIGSQFDYSIYRYVAMRFSEDASGNIVTEMMSTAETNLIGGAAGSTQVVDAFGKGLPDLIFKMGCGDPADDGFGVPCKVTATADFDDSPLAGLAFEQVYQNRNYGSATSISTTSDFEPRDMLTAVTNGMGVESRWSYLPLSSSQNSDSTVNTSAYKVYNKTEAETAVDGDALFAFASSMYVVTQFSQSDNTGDYNDTTYQYRGAVYNAQGRGFQGFRQVIVDNPSDIRAVTDFDQQFPLTGSVNLIRTCLIDTNDRGSNLDCSNDKLSQQDMTYFVIATADAKSSWPVTETNISKTFDSVTGNELSINTTTINLADVDLYGNILKTIVEIDNGFSEVKVTTDNVYSHVNVNDWWISQLETTTVTSETEVGSAVHDTVLDPDKKIETRYTWTTDRLPDLLTVTPILGGGKITVVDTDYNTFALPTKIQTYESGLAGNARSVTTSYSNDGQTAVDDGYFVHTVTNDLTHSVTTKTSPEFGLAIEVTDANGNKIATSYDSFGRVEEVTPPVEIGRPSYSRFADCSGGCDEALSIVPIDLSTLIVPDVAALIAYKITTYSAGAPETTLYKDKFNRVLFAKTQGFDGSPIFVRTEYDHLGRKVFESIPSFVVDEDKGVHFVSYDQQGRLLEKRTDEPDGQFFTVTYAYTDHATSIQAVGSSGHTINMSRTHSGNGQLLKTIDGIGGVTEYAYDAQGNPIILKDANLNSIQAEYNALGQKLYVIDPNMGRKEFTYTAFGEVDTEKDAKNVITDYDYDILGRLTERTAAGILEASFTFDSADKGTTGNVCLGAPAAEVREDSGDDFNRQYTYDDSCRPSAVVTNIDGTPYTQSTQYDGFYGRVKGTQTVSGVTIENIYNRRGYLTHSKNASSGYVYQEATDMNAKLQLTAASKANGVLSEVLEYAEETGQMLLVRTEASGNLQRHRIAYEYNDFGNLKLQQVEEMLGDGSVVTYDEDYEYDDLHRLTMSHRVINGIEDTLNYDYDAVGNINIKDDFSTDFTYGDIARSNGNAGPNAVRQVVKTAAYGGGTVTYAYDLNGNMTSGDGRTLSYNVFNKPLSIEKGGIASNFSYGANQMRYKQVKTGLPDGTETTIYIDKAYEEITQDGVTKKRSYLGDAILTETIGGADAGYKIGFVHRDRLGSVVTITDHAGVVVDNKSFDPFGKVRKGNMDKVDPNSIANLSVVALLGGYDLQTNRGFTDHEHLDDAELIHMNGRVYDYNLGRFLSVDPFIQDVGNSQGVNPYSYMMNNPLMGTDPTGYEIKCDTDWCHGVPRRDSDSDDGPGDESKETDNGSEDTTPVTITGSRNDPSVDLPDIGSVPSQSSPSDKGGAGLLDTATLATLTGATAARKTPAPAQIKAAVGLAAAAGTYLGLKLKSTMADDDASVLPLPLELQTRAQQIETYEKMAVKLKTMREDDSEAVFILYHGTDKPTGLRLLAGEPLNFSLAMENRKTNGETGFYLATNFDDALYFAERTGNGYVLQYTLTESAMKSLLLSGSTIKSIPPGQFYFPKGLEFFTPPSAFPTFNSQRAKGDIIVR